MKTSTKKATPPVAANKTKSSVVKKATPVKNKPAAPLARAKAPATTKPAKTKPALALAVKAEKVVPAAVKKTAAAPSKSSAPPKGKPSSLPAAHKTAPVSEMKSMTLKKVATPLAQPTVAAALVPVAPDQPIRATRPSARLTQITVPSLPPAVASTAAKASFMPSAPAAAVSVPFAPIKKDPKLTHNWKTKPLESLSDAEILAMPDTEYMNSVQMAYFRRKLTALKVDILSSAGATTEHLREDTAVVPDPADRATIEEEHALELRTRDRERKLLKKIEQSMGLIDAGEYGYCDETGEPIGVGRLLARPTATLSLEAQQRRELKQKMFGD